MTAAYQNLYLEQGTTFSTTITMSDVYGNAYDLTSFSANSQIKRSYYSSTTTGYFNTSLNVSDGSVTIAMDANTSATIPAGQYVYDVKMVNSINGLKVRILEGMVFVSPQVSQV